MTDPKHDDTGEPHEVQCPHCGGSGEVLVSVTHSTFTDIEREFKQRCYLCGGSGKVSVTAEGVGL